MLYVFVYAKVCKCKCEKIHTNNVVKIHQLGLVVGLWDRAYNLYSIKIIFSMESPYKT